MARVLKSKAQVPSPVPAPETLHRRIAKALRWQLHSAVGLPLVTLRIWCKTDGAHSVSEDIQKLIDKGQTHLGPLP